MILSSIGPQSPASATVGGSTLPASPTFRQVFTKSGSSSGLYVCVSDGAWVGPLGTGSGTIGGSTGSTDNRVLRSDGTGGSTLQNSAVTISDAGAITGATLAASAITSGTLAVARGGTGSGTYTKGDLLVSPGGAALSLLPVGADGAVLTASSGTGTGLQWIAPVAGVTNSAPANTVTKSDGTNLVASQITDDGTDVIIGNPSGLYAEVNQTSQFIELKGAAGTGLYADDGLTETRIGDFEDIANGTKVVVKDSTKTITATASTESLAVDGVAHTLSLTAATAVTVTTNGGVAGFPSGATGTVALVGTNLGTVLSIPSANATLASATGTTYSSPGYGGTPLASTSESQVGWVCPRAGSISKLYVITGSVAKVNTPATTITLRKAGADTAVTLVLTQTTATVSSDLTHSFSVAAGDIISISFVTTGAAAVSTSIAGISFLLN